MPSPADRDDNRRSLLAVPGVAVVGAPIAASAPIEASRAVWRMAHLRPDLVAAFERVAGGDRAALELLYGSSSVKLYGNVQRILGQQDWGQQDWADAVLEDVVEQISRRVDRPVAMVKSSLGRSLAQLKECLGR